MSDELSEELQERDRAARALAEHLRRMGAASATIPVVIEDEAYEVVVRHKPVSPEWADD